MALTCEAAHRQAVLAYALGDDPAAPLGGEPDVAAGDLRAGGHPLDIPLPRARERLVEVVRAEDQPPVGRREGPEVRDVGVPAGLHDDAAVGGPREVGGHHRGGAAKEGERRQQHAPVADRQELLDARGGLMVEQGDGIRPVGRGRPVPVHGSGHVPARSATALGRLTRLERCDRVRARPGIGVSAHVTRDPRFPGDDSGGVGLPV